MSSPYDIVRDFENAVGDYTGAPYVVAVNSCTNALFLCLMWFRANKELPKRVEIPKRSYLSVPMQIMHSGARPAFRNEDWTGTYQLSPLPLWDAARRFTSGMYREHTFMCTSHHWSKPLGIQQGGCILHDNPDADKWLRRARFDGRTEGVPAGSDDISEIGWHMYMTPEIAAEGRMRLSLLPKHIADIPRDDYPDLSKMTVFK